MTSAYLPSLEPATQRREKIRKRVRAVSVAQYADGRERFVGRKATVLRWLAAYYNQCQGWPTSAELAQQAWLDSWPLPDWTDRLLYIRRGLCDLQTTGTVEAVPAGQRRCAVTGRRCEVWRVTPAGGSR